MPDGAPSRCATCLPGRGDLLPRKGSKSTSIGIWAVVLGPSPNLYTILEGSADVAVNRTLFSLLALLLLAAANPHWTGSTARADSPVMAPAPFKVPPEGTRLVYENLETGDRERRL